LEDGNNIIEDDAQLKQHITNYYKNMFGPPESSSIVLEEHQVQDIPQVSDLENEFLTDVFSESEVKAAWCSRWNTIRHQDRMAFHLSFIRSSRI
jgi:hypothetical protein